MAELTTLEEKLAQVLGLAQAAPMMSTYLGGASDGLDGFEFLTHGRGRRGRPLGGAGQVQAGGRCGVGVSDPGAG